MEATNRHYADLLAEIQALLRAPIDGEGAPSLAAVETTMTDVCAHAHALEGERFRLQRRISEVAASGDSATEELALLAARLSATDRDLSYLRELLVSLRRRHREVRVALSQPAAA